MTTSISATGLAGRMAIADPKGKATLAEYVEAIALIAQAFITKYNRQPESVCLPYDTPDEIYIALQSEVTIRAKNQPPGIVWVGVDGDLSLKTGGVGVTVKVAMPESEEGDKPSPGHWMLIAQRPNGTTSHVSRIMWHNDTLYVAFNDGSMYSYAAVDEPTFRKMVKAPSIGDYLHQNIKGNYAHKRLSAAEIKMIDGGIPKTEEGDSENFLSRYMAARKKDDKPQQAIVPRPGVYVTLPPTTDPLHAFEVAIQDGYQQMVGKGYPQVNHVALPLNTPPVVADTLRQNGVGVATWPAPDNQVWVGILDD